MLAKSEICKGLLVVTVGLNYNYFKWLKWIKTDHSKREVIIQIIKVEIWDIKWLEIYKKGLAHNDYMC